MGTEMAGAAEDIRLPKSDDVSNVDAGAEDIKDTPRSEVPSPHLPPERGPEWDIAHSERKEGIRLYFGLMWMFGVRLYFACLGLMCLIIGYFYSKVWWLIFGGKVADSWFLRTGFRLFMYFWGVVPEVEYDPVPKEGEEPRCKAARRRGKDMSQTPILVSNHISYLDGPALAAMLNVPKIVAMAGSKNVPLFGRLVEDIECVLVERSDENSRRATLEAIEGHCTQWTAGRRPLLIFPEGGVTNGLGLDRTFKKGAFIPGRPVRPVLVVYTGTWVPAACTWFQSKDGSFKQDSIKDWFMQFWGHLFHRMKVFVLPPYEPSEEEKANADLYSENVRRYMNQQLRLKRKKLGFSCPSSEPSSKSD